MLGTCRVRGGELALRWMLEGLTTLLLSAATSAGLASSGLTVICSSASRWPTTVFSLMVPLRP